jgi:hypothetical protein
MSDYLQKKWKSPAQLDAEHLHEHQIPGKTRAELDRELKEIRRQVDEDLKIWSKPPHRIKGPDKAECVLIGLALGCLLMFLINGGCHMKLNIKSTPNDSQDQTTQQ